MERCRVLETGETARATGFTLLEIMVSVFVAGVAILVTLLVAGAMTRQLSSEQLTVSAQDNARAALDEVTRSLRAAGSGTDYTEGQGRFVYAAPFTVAFNANQSPANDPDGSGSPRALNPAQANASVPLADGQTYTPPRAYATGAETIVLTVDSNRDGQITTADAGDDEEEASTNPRDYDLKQYVYGNNGTANTVASTGLAILRGPVAAPDGTLPEPLFKYWVDEDNNPTTPSKLHGDTNGDGKLSQTEIAGMTAVSAAQLGLIERIDVTATAESEKPREGSTKYASTVLHSTVSFRNRNSTAAHIVGRVFHDVNRNTTQDAGEVGLKDVVIRCSNGYKTKTDTDGNYVFVLTPGTYTITETDPAGYSSTTPNAVAVAPAPGDYLQINFGDRSTLGTGRILGTVYEDRNQNGTKDTGERAISGVRIFLDSGASANTNAQGKFQFTVSTKNYVVTEEDSVGYVSSTPNVVDVTLHADGDSSVVNFGDYKLANTGKIHGVVYSDANNNHVKDTGEAGIANVTITLDTGQATAATDSKGEFLFNATAGSHEVTETDPPGYTSSTLNTLTVTVVVNQTVEVAFGDIGQQDITFQEIALGSTRRALSIASLDTGEDNKADIDLTLGTQYVSGSNDVLVWWNNRNNSSTPNSALFASTADYQRVQTSDVNSLAAVDLNGDSRGDLITALGGATNNIAVWLMQGSGSNKGQLPSSPTATYTASIALAVNDVVTGKFDPDAYTDFAVGTRTGVGMGKLEIWHGSSSASTFTRATKDLLATLPGTATGLGEVYCLSAADFNGDGKTDLVVGARTSSVLSAVYLLMYDPSVVPGSDYYLKSTLPVPGQIQDVLALDMLDDASGKVDIVTATETSPTTGTIQVWLNRGDNTFGQGSTPNTTPDDTASPGGSPLSVVAAKIDNDIYPDLVVGTRSSSSYTGQVLVYRGYGYIPSQGVLISSNTVGEVITLTTSDYNKDGAPDVAAGTRTSSSTGKVVIFFNTTH